MTTKLEAFALTFLPTIYRRIFDLLSDGVVRDTAEIAAAVHTNVHACREALNKMMAHNVVQVGEWRRLSDRGPVRACFTVGRKSNLPRPPRKTASQKCHDWRERVKARPSAPPLPAISFASQFLGGPTK